MSGVPKAVLDDVLAESMRRTRARFKLSLRWCRAHEDHLRAQALADKLAEGDTVAKGKKEEDGEEEL